MNFFKMWASTGRVDSLLVKNVISGQTESRFEETHIYIDPRKFLVDSLPQKVIWNTVDRQIISPELQVEMENKK